MSTVSPYSTRLPRYITPTVSEMCSTTLRSWEMNRYVSLYFSCSSWSRLIIWAWMDTSRALTGSSHTTNSGFRARALAMQMRWRWPPENSWG